MRTRVLNTGQANAYVSAVAEAARTLRDGGLVVFPTETVYGVGANAASPAAVARLRDVKGRDEQQPFTVHVGAKSDIRKYLTAPSAVTRRLVRRAWPGPVTLVCAEPDPLGTQVATLCSPEEIADLYRDRLVGLRCPDHPVAARLLVEAGVPVIASSANRRGAAPPTDLAEALRDLDGAVDCALDAGRTRYHKASTIVQIRGNEWDVLRAGAVDERTIARLATSDILFVCTGNSCRSPMAECLFRDALGRALGLNADQLAAAGYRVLSAGTMGGAGAPASSGALEEMARRGLDVTRHRSQALTPELVHRAERIYVMSSEHRQSVLNLVPGAAARVVLLDPAGPVVDPIGGTAEQYRRCAEQIARAIDVRLEEFLDEDRHW